MKFIALALSLYASVLCTSANASVIGFSHEQTTLNEELLATIHCDRYPCDVTTRAFEIFNLTGVLWSDYHLRIEADVAPFHLNEENDGITPIFDNISLLDSSFDPDRFLSVEFSGTSAEFFNGSISVGASFEFSSRVIEQGGIDFINAIETYQIFGTPSVIPTPSTLALLGLGIMLLRRRMNANR